MSQFFAAPAKRYRLLDGSICTVQNPLHPSEDPLDVHMTSRNPIQLRFANDYVLTTTLENGVPVGDFTLEHFELVDSSSTRSHATQRRRRNQTEPTITQRLQSLDRIQGFWERNILTEQMERRSERLKIDQRNREGRRERRQQRPRASSLTSLTTSLRFAPSDRDLSSLRQLDEEIKLESYEYPSIVAMKQNLGVTFTKNFSRSLRHRPLRSFGANYASRYHPIFHNGVLLDCKMQESRLKVPRGGLSGSGLCGKGGVFGLLPCIGTFAGSNRIRKRYVEEEIFTGSLYFWIDPSTLNRPPLVPTSINRHLPPLPFRQISKSNFFKWGYGQSSKKLVEEYNVKEEKEKLISGGFNDLFNDENLFCSPSDRILAPMEFYRGMFENSQKGGIGICANSHAGTVFAGAFSRHRMGSSSSRSNRQERKAIERQDVVGSGLSEVFKRIRKRSRPPGFRGLGFSSSAVPSFRSAGLGLGSATGSVLGGFTSSDVVSSAEDVDVDNEDEGEDVVVGGGGGGLAAAKHYGGVLSISDGRVFLGDWEDGLRTGPSTMIAPSGDRLFSRWKIESTGSGGGEFRSVPNENYPHQFREIDSSLSGPHPPKSIAALRAQICITEGRVRHRIEGGDYPDSGRCSVEEVFATFGGNAVDDDVANRAIGVWDVFLATERENLRRDLLRAVRESPAASQVGGVSDTGSFAFAQRAYDLFARVLGARDGGPSRESESVSRRSSPLEGILKSFQRFFETSYRDHLDPSGLEASYIRVSRLLPEAKDDIYQFAGNLFLKIYKAFADNEIMSGFTTAHRSITRPCLFVVVLDMVLDAVYDDLWPLYVDSNRLSPRGMRHAVNCAKLRGADPVKLTGCANHIPSYFLNRISLFPSAIRAADGLDTEARTLTAKTAQLMNQQINMRCELVTYGILRVLEKKGYRCRMGSFLEDNGFMDDSDDEDDDDGLDSEPSEAEGEYWEQFLQRERGNEADEEEEGEEENPIIELPLDIEELMEEVRKLMALSLGNPTFLSLTVDGSSKRVAVLLERLSRNGVRLDDNAAEVLRNAALKLTTIGAEDLMPPSQYVFLHSDYDALANLEFLIDWICPEWERVNASLRLSRAGLELSTTWVMAAEPNMLLEGLGVDSFTSVVTTAVKALLTREEGEIQMDWLVDLFVSIALDIAVGKTTTKDTEIILPAATYPTLHSMLDEVLRLRPNPVDMFLEQVENSRLGFLSIGIENVFSVEGGADQPPIRAVVVRLKPGSVRTVNVYQTLASSTLTCLVS